MTPASGYFLPIARHLREITLFPAGTHRIQAGREEPGSPGALSSLGRAHDDCDFASLVAFAAAIRDPRPSCAAPGFTDVRVDQLSFDAIEAAFRSIEKRGIRPALNINHVENSPVACELESVRWEPARGIIAVVSRWGDIGELALARGGWGVSPAFSHHAGTGRPVALPENGIIGSITQTPAFGELLALPRILS